MKFSIQVGEFRGLLRALGTVVNARSSHPSFRHVGARIRGGKLAFSGCATDLMAYTDTHSASFDGAEGDGFQIDLSHFSKLLDTFQDDALIVLNHRPHEGSIQITCGRHLSEHGVDFDARLEDMLSPTDFGGLASEDWLRYDLPLGDLVKRVEFAMLRREETFDFDNTKLDSVRVKFADPHVTVEATDNRKFAHYQEYATKTFPDADFLLPQAVVKLVHRHGFTRLYWNKHAFCFCSGKYGVDLYCRSLATAEEFPDLTSVFNKFRAGKFSASVIVDRLDLMRALRRQALLAVEGKPAHMALKPESREIEFLVPGVGSDTVSFTPEMGGGSSSLLKIHPEHLLACAERIDLPRLSLMLHQQKEAALVGFRPVEEDLLPPPPPAAMMHPDNIPEDGAIPGLSGQGFSEGAEFYFVSAATPVTKS